MTATKTGEVGFWAAACERATVNQALKVAAVVGTLLVAINQGDVLLAGQAPNWFKIILTYVVPYAVSTYSAAMFRVAASREAVPGAEG